MENTEKLVALRDLVSQGEIGVQKRTYTFETPISKLIGKPKYEINETVPVPGDMPEAELIAAAIGTTPLKLVRRALDIELRTVYVESVKAEKVAIEAEAIKAVGL